MSFVETVNGRTIGAQQVATFRAKPYPRTIERANILGPPNSLCALYVGAINPTSFRDGSGSGASDTGEYPTGLHVPAGNNVFLVWNDTSSQATAILQWREG